MIQSSKVVLEKNAKHLGASELSNEHLILLVGSQVTDFLGHLVVVKDLVGLSDLTPAAQLRNQVDDLVLVSTGELQADLLYSFPHFLTRYEHDRHEF